MKKNTIPSWKTCIAICAVMMLALLILQFIPFWNVDGTNVSIAGYIGFPGDCPEMETYLTAQVGEDYIINEVFVAPLTLLLVSLAGIVIAIITKCHQATILCSTYCGAAGIWMIASSKAFRLGSCWQLILVLSILTLAASLLALILFLYHRN